MERENNFLTDQQIQKIESKLLKDQMRILSKHTDPSVYCLDRNELSDPLDEANINIQTSQELRFRNRETFYLKKIGKSLQKIKDHTMGICEECGDEVNFERLLARPTAEMCINCKEESETVERTNVFKKRSKSLGRSLYDLAKN